mmetsp:Transcript_74019/g.197259  ORF Transcript_74019/g.197259 Transcript_74019/m.197259 type:complete len:90 (-) Transcript_74019:233-502(-)
MPLLIPELRLDIICFSHFSHLLMIIPQVRNRVAIPDEMIPADAHVEIDAKMYAGYYVPENKRGTVNEDLVKLTKGRSLDEDLLAGPMDD